MQTPTWIRHFEPGQFKLIIVAVAATVILLLTAVVSTTPWSDDQAGSIERAGIGQLQPTPNTRFLERNILPGDPRTYLVTSLREYRFLDWNILPGDDALLAPPSKERGTRY